MSEVPNNDHARRYREAAELLEERPSAATRAAILAAAARAVEARPHDAASSAPINSRRRYRFPLAAAAAVMLSTLAVMLATRTEREQPRFDEPAAPAIAQAPSTITAPSEFKSVDTPAKIQEERARAPEPTSKEAAASQAVARDSAARSEPMREIRQPQSKAAERGLTERRSTESDASGFAQAPSPSPTPTAKLATPAAPPPASAPAAAAAPSVTDGASEAVGRLRKDERQSVASEKPAAAAPASRVAGNAALQSKADLDASTWLEKIVALRAKGDDAEADAELKRFRERYPEVVVPPQALTRPGTR